MQDGLSYLEYLQNNRTASFRNMALSHSDTPITDYSSAINARLFLCTTRGIYNSQFGLIIQSLTCVYDGPLMEGGLGVDVIVRGIDVLDKRLLSIYIPWL